MKLRYIIVFLYFHCFHADSADIKDCEYFQLRVGTWSGITTSHIVVRDQTVKGTGDSECRFILSDAFVEITGKTEAAGRMKTYKWIYRSTEKSNEFAYVYFDSNGVFGEGTALFDPESKSLKVVSIDEKTMRESVTISTFSTAKKLTIRHTYTESNGNLLFEGEATYERRN